MNAHTARPLRYPDEASREGVYHLRGGPHGHRVGLAYTLADARLWAAAPDLLEACEAAEAAIVAAGMFLPDGDDTDRLCATTLADLMRASRKAREG